MTLRSLLNRRVNNAKPFSQQIIQANRIRKENIQKLKSFIKENTKYQNDRNRCFKLCDEKIECGVSVAVVGLLNSGKSLLVSALLEWQIVLPSSDEATTGRLTRFVYSQTPIIRRITTGQWDMNKDSNDYGNCLGYKESELSQDAFNEDNLSDCIHLSTEDRDDVESLSIIIEIGIPSEVLKTGLKIIDCPGLGENKMLSKMELIMLERMNPSVICYVYDHRQGFSLEDGVRLKELMIDDKESFEFLIVANKCDSFDDNLIDATQQNSIQFNENQANTTIRQNTPWKHHMTPPYLDKDKLLPVLPLSTGKLFLSQSHTDNKENRECRTMLCNLQNQIASKIIAQSRSIVSLLAKNSISDSNTKLFFLLQSLAVEDDLIELMIRECCDDSSNLLVDFTGGYKVYGVKYRGDDIHVTSLSKTSQIDFKLEKKRIHFDCGRSPIIYSNEDQSMIYLIEKERPRKRLIDHLNEYSLHQIIKNLHWCFCDNKSKLLNFHSIRPDNVYVEENGSISINQTVPNHPDLPFLLKNKKSIQPFHLHPQLKEDYSFYEDLRLMIIQNLYSFGCLISILVDGEGTKLNDPIIDQKFQLLEQGKFSYFAKYLKELMELCLRVSEDDKNSLNEIIIEMKDHWLRINEELSILQL